MLSSFVSFDLYIINVLYLYTMSDLYLFIANAYRTFFFLLLLLIKMFIQTVSAEWDNNHSLHFCPTAENVWFLHRRRSSCDMNGWRQHTSNFVTTQSALMFPVFQKAVQSDFNYCIIIELCINTRWILFGCTTNRHTSCCWLAEVTAQGLFALILSHTCCVTTVNAGAAKSSRTEMLRITTLRRSDSFMAVVI